MASQQAEAIKALIQTQIAESIGQDRTLEEMRAAAKDFGQLTAEPEGVTWRDVDAGGVPAIWADPSTGAADRALHYVHGGGYVIGSAAEYKKLCERRPGCTRAGGGSEGDGGDVPGWWRRPGPARVPHPRRLHGHLPSVYPGTWGRDAAGRRCSGRAGGAAEWRRGHLEVFPEMQHVFPMAAGNMPEADDAVAKIGAWLRPRLGLA